MTTHLIRNREARITEVLYSEKETLCVIIKKNCPLKQLFTWWSALNNKRLKHICFVYIGSFNKLTMHNKINLFKKCSYPKYKIFPDNKWQEELWYKSYDHETYRNWATLRGQSWVSRIKGRESRTKTVQQHPYCAPVYHTQTAVIHSQKPNRQVQTLLSPGIVSNTLTWTFCCMYSHIKPVANVEEWFCAFVCF